MKRTLLISPVKSDNSKGFTLVELLVSIGITAMLGVVLVAYMTASMAQIAISTSRSSMSSMVQTAFIRISDDIRTSSNVSLCNLTPDANAPQTLTGLSANVPCSSDPANSNYQMFWRLSSNQLILNKTPVDASGNAIYDDPDSLTGDRDVIIYYVKNGSLYRRVVPAPYTSPVSNAEVSVTCPSVILGGCSNDTLLVSGLKMDEPGGPFKLKYSNAAGNEITTGPSGNDYSGFISARSIDVNISVAKIQNGQTIKFTNGAKMTFRATVVPGPDYTPTLPPDYGMPSPSMMAGPGGVIAGQFTDIGPATIYVKGKFTIDRFSNVGTSATYSNPAVPANLNVANVACGTGNSYPAPCPSGSNPMEIVSWPVTFVGPVCATGQTSRISSGQIIPCTAPVKDLPVLNKQAFVTSMKAGTVTSSSAGVCPVFEANKIYDGNMRISCSSSEIKGNMYIKGNFTLDSFRGLKVAESAGLKRPIIVVNGKIKLDRFTGIDANSYGTLPYFVSMFTTDTACMNSNSCTSISGSSLLSTMNNHTGEGNAAISVAASDAGTTVFYSYFGETYIGGLTNVGAIAGQRIRISGLTTINLSMPL